MIKDCGRSCDKFVFGACVEDGGGFGGKVPRPKREWSVEGLIDFAIVNVAVVGYNNISIRKSQNGCGVTESEFV